MTELTIPKIDDMHIHLRQGEKLADFTRDAARSAARGIVMPNTLPPVTDRTTMEEYRRHIIAGAPDFTPLMTIKLTAETTPDTIAEAKNAGLTACKLYPQGATTNAEDGIDEIDKFFDLFKAMEELELPLCIHCEDPTAPVLERERAYYDEFLKLYNTFPRLKMVFEHISDGGTIDFVLSLDRRVSGTITLHHMLFSLDDLIGGMINPHLFCKPIVKTGKDRRKIVAAATGDQQGRFFFGSDSAPHLRDRKESPNGSAGIYTAPFMLEALTQLFEEAFQGISKQAQLQLENFTSRWGAEFYELPRNQEKVCLKKEKWLVPAEYHGVVPAMAGQELSWKITG